MAGLAKMGFTAGAVRYDDPPPDRITDLAALHAAERFRFANHLAVSELAGASPFPRHWIYDQRGRLVAKSGLAAYEEAPGLPFAGSRAAPCWPSRGSRARICTCCSTGSWMCW